MISPFLAGALCFGFAIGDVEVESAVVRRLPDYDHDEKKSRGQQLLDDFSVAVSTWEDFIRGVALVVQQHPSQLHEFPSLIG